MQAERIPTREEIIARRAKLGMRAHQAVVPVERVWSAERRRELEEREAERRAVEAYRRLEDEQRADRLSSVIAAALEASKRLASNISGTSGAVIMADVARWVIRDEADLAGVDKSDIMSRRRSGPAVMARHRAIYRVKRLTSWSLPRIGRFFDDRDHTTVMYAVRKITAMVESGAIEDPAMRDVGARHDA